METIQASCQALGTKQETMDAFFKKMLALMDDKVSSCEFKYDTLCRDNAQLRKEVRDLRIELRDLKEGRSVVSG